MKNSSRKSAFSLIEISIVILIIGILVAGVTQSSRLLTQARLSSAKTLTESSPVASVRNLSLWIESTSDSSFSIAAAAPFVTSSDFDNNTTITRWFDLNPQTTNKIALIAAGTPRYLTNSINGLPAVSFPAAADFFSTAGFINITNSSTVFAVVRLPAALAAQTILSKRATGGGANVNIDLSTKVATAWSYIDGGATYDSAAAGVANNSFVVSVVYNANSALGATTATGVSFFQNGVLTGQRATTNNNPAAIGDNLFIGKSGVAATPATFGGTIGEIIIFDRALRREERQSIETYLGKKWGITVTAAAI